MLDIEYEFAFFSLSSSNRDEDLNSDLDKFESFLRKDDSALLLQNKVACAESMRQIEMVYGPFDEDEVKFYYDALSDETSHTISINAFQKQMVFSLFYKFFGDPSTINCINAEDYVKLIIASRRILEDAGMVLLPHIISSKVLHLATRKTINKKDLIKLELSETYQRIQRKYRSEKMKRLLIALIATTMSSDFQAIEPDDLELNGMKIQIIPDLVMEEIAQYIDMV